MKKEFLRRPTSVDIQFCTTHMKVKMGVLEWLVVLTIHAELEYPMIMLEVVGSQDL